MKHNSRITVILILVFLIAQVFGLFTINSYIQVEVNETTGKIIVAHPDTAIGEIPELEEKEKEFAFLPIIITVLLGTMLLFLLIKLGWGFIFKYWFLFAILVSLAVTFEVYFSKIFNPTVSIVSAFVLGLIFAVWKVFRPNVYVHNITEVFTYTGIAIIFSGFLNLNSAILLLLLISVYDAIAVWKSKHMIKLAEFQTNSKAFAGLSIPYSVKKKNEKKVVMKKVKAGKGVPTAILGGGDIAFPLLFSSTAMQHFIGLGFTKTTALIYGLIITAGVTISLAWLLFKSEKDKFYPAMPFLTAGCLVGYGIVSLII